MKVLVTGVNGFIGSHFVRYLLVKNEQEINIIGFGRKSNERNELRLGLAKENPRFRMIYGDLSDLSSTSGLCEDVDVVVNFAAKTFVDHSIKDDESFWQSNVLGARNLMKDAMRYGVKKFIQVSTDEVYGEILEGRHTEESPLHPRNPYAAAKASADCMALSYFHTHGFPVIVTRTENNFGEWQDPQKAMPKFTKYALENKPLPIYGDGMHVRCWLYVRDHCDAIWHLVNYGTPGEIYNIAGERELTNIDLSKRVLDFLGKPHDLINFIDDYDIRPGHDRRYAIDVSKLKETGWTSKYSLDGCLQRTVWWYRDNLWWLQ